MDANKVKELKAFQDGLKTTAGTAVVAIGLLTVFNAVINQKPKEEEDEGGGYRGFKNYEDWYQNSLDSPLNDGPLYFGEDEE